MESCSRWLVDNKLSLHVEKCESIVFGSSRKLKGLVNFSISCFDVPVRRVSTVKYLGVCLDENLNGHQRASDVGKKVASRLSFLYRNSGLLDRRARKTLCSALIQPLFDYCCSSWYSGLGAKFKGKLDVLQRKMIRFVFNLDARSAVTREHLVKLQWLSICDRVKYFKLIHAYKIYKGLAPTYVSDSFRGSASIHAYDTRGSSTNFFIDKEDTAGSMSSSFVYTAKKEWNSLPTDLKKVPNLIIFKKKLRQFLLGSY